MPLFFFESGAALFHLFLPPVSHGFGFGPCAHTQHNRAQAMSAEVQNLGKRKTGGDLPCVHVE